MNYDNGFDWFRLSQVKGVGVKFLWEVYDFISQESLSLSDLLDEKPINALNIPPKLKAKLTSCLLEQDYEVLERTYARLGENNATLLSVEDSLFPSKIKQLGREYGIPPCLYFRGNSQLANGQSISIVGSRNIDKDAMVITAKLAKDLATDGFNVVSGYAKGVDSTAHLGALEAEGTTTIVLSLGILNFEVKKDFQPWISRSNTLVLSQFNPSDKWLARNAMARNKLVCGLSDAVIVIAAGQEIDSQGRRSGTFDAAKSALKMNLPVFVLSPKFFPQPPAGNIDLIKLGCHEFSPENPVQQIISKLQGYLKDENTPINKQNAVQLDLFTSALIT